MSGSDDPTLTSNVPTEEPYHRPQWVYRSKNGTAFELVDQWNEKKEKSKKKRSDGPTSYPETSAPFQDFDSTHPSYKSNMGSIDGRDPYEDQDFYLTRPSYKSNMSSSGRPHQDFYPTQPSYKSNMSSRDARPHQDFYPTQPPYKCNMGSSDGRVPHNDFYPTQPSYKANMSSSDERHQDFYQTQKPYKYKAGSSDGRARHEDFYPTPSYKANMSSSDRRAPHQDFYPTQKLYESNMGFSDGRVPYQGQDFNPTQPSYETRSFDGPMPFPKSVPTPPSLSTLESDEGLTCSTVHRYSRYVLRSRNGTSFEIVDNYEWESESGYRADNFGYSVPVPFPGTGLRKPWWFKPMEKTHDFIEGNRFVRENCRPRIVCTCQRIYQGHWLTFDRDQIALNELKNPKPDRLQILEKAFMMRPCFCGKYNVDEDLAGSITTVAKLSCKAIKVYQGRRRERNT